MLRLALVCFLLTSAAGLGGCTMAHTQVASLPSPAVGDGSESAVEPLAQIYANAYGYDLFGLPLISGAARYANTRSIAWFEDGSTVPTITEMILEEARKQGATHIIDLQTNFLSEWIGWSLIFWTPEAQGSATAIRVNRGAPPSGAIPVGDASGNG